MRLLRMVSIRRGTFALLLVAALPAAAAAQDRLEPDHQLIGYDRAINTRVRAQTPFVPYFMKNDVRYDKFDWHIYTTDHFKIYFYPSIEPHLQRVSSYAESAYQHISSQLKHDLAQKVPLILFKTQSEFQEQHVQDALPEGVLAFAEPEENRVVLPLDLPSDQLYQLITHELTHIFEFDIIPRGIINSSLPLWMDEGLSDYMAGAWNPLDLMTVRDAAISDTVPRMSELEDQPITSGREPYELGHAAFDFIESKWGMDGLRQFLFSLRKSIIGGSGSAYEEAFKIKAEDFDDQFDRYLKERFKPFRDKERPSDYGRDLTLQLEHTPYTGVYSIEPSPTGDIIAAMVGNAHDQELDIILLSAKDGQVIRNLTPGLDKDRGFEYIEQAGGLRGNMVPWMGWSPVGDRMAYFVRTEKEHTLIIENVVSTKTVQRFDLKTVDGPESPAFSPDGSTVIFSAMQGAVGDIFSIDLKNGQITNLTKDQFDEFAPAYSPDGKSIVYTAHISGDDKLFELDLASGRKKQLTFGAHIDTGAKFYDDHTIVFTSTATDPNVRISPEVAKNGNVPNVWTLDLTTNELKQWTDTATGNLSPIVLHQAAGAQVAFITFYKGNYGLHTISLAKPVATVASSDFGAPGPIIEFQPPISEPLMRDNIHKKGAWETMHMAGRPPLNLGVTSNGNFYGNTELQFEDVLGDKQVSFYAQTVSSYRSTALTYTNIEHRLQYAMQGFSQDVYYYGQNVQNAVYYDPSLAPYISRDLAQAVQSERGGSIFAIYPFDRYRRVELTGAFIHVHEAYANSQLQVLADQYQQGAYGGSLFRNGYMAPLGIAYVEETTVFRDYGPVAGRTMRIEYSGAPKFGSALSRQTADIDIRHYTRIAANGVFAVRLKAQKSWGATPDFMYFGGNSELRGYDYLSFLGQKGFFADAELRFPLIDAMLTPFGVLGGMRGVFFGDIGAVGLDGQTFTPWTSKSESYTPLLGYQTIDQFGNVAPVYGSPVTLSGFRLKDARASYGVGLETFFLGLPMHFDWSWKTLFNKSWENALFADSGGSTAFRAKKFSFWMGYDF